MEPLKIIKHALDSTIALINKGEKPTSALEKVARELDLNPNYIQRTGEALNVALTYDHFKKNASDKAAEFDIADTQSATKNIFGEREKTLAEKKAEWFPRVVEDFDYNKLLTNPKLKKTASQISATPEKNDSFGITYKGQFKKAQDYISRLDRELDVIKTEKVANDAYLEGAFFSLIKGFKKEASARTSFDEFESQAFATFGERAVPYIDLIYKSAAISDERGSHDDKYINFTPCREIELFGSVLKSAEAKIKLAAEVAEAEEYVSSQHLSFKQAGYRLNPVAQAFDKIACDQLADEIGEIEKQAVGEIGRGALMDLLTKFHDTMTGSNQPKPVFQNSQSDNKDRMLILQDLIMTDPILKKIDPRKIIQAYQQILRLSPQLTKEKQVLAAHLRGMTAAGDGGLHATDANQLVDVNTNLMKQQQMLKQTEGGDGGKKK